MNVYSQSAKLQSVNNNLSKSATRSKVNQESADIRKIGLNPNFWYPLARSKNLRIGKPLAVTFAGEPIMLVRPEKGDLFALEDRCAHRQIPLHLGVVRGERVQCHYHCWTYDRQGSCVNIPYLDGQKHLPNGVHSYPVREAYGLIFVYTGDLNASGFSQFPEVQTFANPKYKTRILDRSISCHYSFMHENLMDMNHQFLHRSLMGLIRTTLLDIRAKDGWVEADYTFSRLAGKQSLGEKFIIGSRKIETDEIDKMTIRTGYPYQTLKFWMAGSSEPALDLWNCYVPTDREQRQNQTYGLLMIAKPSITMLIHLLWPFIVAFTNGIFAQDQEIVEVEQRAFDQQGADWNHEISPAILQLRKLLIHAGVPLNF
ncbi:ring-hydroxylating dioxygenase, large terminal subunit [Synechococcus sp. PCC 7502]|uniref:aromatic ring-hydroxylating oxygenase subunit alpha n=1 Tax=Synechococcus sp. PCC 7502 TaxID=1173263 RepID=UPI00029F9EF9|nr:aromatic ring-hydroxylating dioxygenase subunit alpha [Synechococcus sp. PCC 7502]AFY73315.1 ring-hydroxylating dioxygenase, large terminal subunit [Synechococcus sp. PCC 7502]